MPDTATATAKAPSRYTFGRIARGLRNRCRSYAEGVVSVFPKLVYGNSAGFGNNYRALRELARLRAKAAVATAVLREEPFAARASDVAQRGYALFPSVHERQALERMKALYNDLIEDSHHSVVSPNGATRFLMDPVGSIPEFKTLLTEELCRVAISYYGCALRIQSVRAWRNHHVPTSDQNREDVFSNTFHHDTLPVTGLRVFVLLSDGVNRETGAFRFLDKNESVSIVRSLGYFHRDVIPPATRRRLTDPTKLRFFEGDMGDTCMVNTQECLHAASVPGPGSQRDILQFEIYPADGPYRSADALFKNIPPDNDILRMRVQ
jgi:hypothetical protein